MKKFRFSAEKIISCLKQAEASQTAGKDCRKMGISYTPTQANFVWIDVARDCKEVFLACLKKGVIVRTGDVFGCPTHIRVTTGTDEQSERFIKTLREVLA